MNKIRKDDQVIILAGKDKGRSGRIIKIVGDTALVEGINVVKKHMKPNPHKRQEGGIVKKESPINLSNVAILNPATKKADKIGVKFIEPVSSGEKRKKVRYFKSNNELVDVG